MNTSPSRPERAATGRLTGQTLWVLAALLSVGVAVRVIVALFHEGVGFDIESFRIVGTALADRGFELYEGLAQSRGHRWPYPPGFLPWIGAASRMVGPHSPLFAFVVKLPLIAADIGIAVAVAAYLRSRGRSSQEQVTAAAAVAIGPIFVLISGFHGQIDAAATLPMILAAYVWQTSTHPRRGLVAGLILGVGVAVKTVPVVLLAAILPMSRSRREAVETSAATAVVPVLALLPFVLRTPDAVVDALTYAGIPGLGGLSLVAQPSIAGWWMGLDTGLEGIGAVLWRLRAPLLAAVAIGIAAVVWRKKPPLHHAGALLFLAIYTFVPNFAFQYLVWGLPFFLMAGYLRVATVAQFALLVPALLLYAPPLYGETTLDIYVGCMVAAWLAGAVAFMMQLRVVARADHVAVRRDQSGLS